MGIKILNLYACLGGNRYKWGNEHHVTAVELDPHLASMYQDRFPNDTVIISDAHQYLLDHFAEFDFIWSSPPCPSHSRVRISQKNRDGFKPIFPDLKLYEEIIFLDNYFKGKYCVENVIPYYEQLLPAQKRGRHLYWTNFKLPNDLGERKFDGTLTNTIDEVGKLCKFHDFDFYKYKGDQPLKKIARNLVDYEAGKTILDTALGVIKKSNANQVDLF